MTPVKSCPQPTFVNKVLQEPGHNYVLWYYLWLLFSYDGS